MKNAINKSALIMVLSGLLALAAADNHAFNSSEELSDHSSHNLPELNGNSPLSDYLSYAAIKNPGLKAAFNEWKADTLRAAQADSLDDPRLNYQYYIEEVETRVGAQRQSLGLSQSLPWFGKLRLKGEIADSRAKKSAKKYEAAKLELFYEISEAFYEYYYLGEAIATTRDNINLLKHIEDVAVSKYKTAKRSQRDVIRIQVELLKLKDRLEELEDMKTTYIARLNAALNRSPDAELEVPASIELYDIQIPDEQVIKLAQKANPELKAFKHELRGADQSIELAKKSYYPDFNIGLTVIDTDDASLGNPSDSGKDPIIASISLTIPLWQDKYNAGVREARRRYFAVRDKKTNATNNLNSELKTALYEYRDADRKIELYSERLLPKARQSLNITETDFRTAKAGFTSLIDAQRILLEFSLSYRRAIADKAAAAAKIEKLAAGIVPFKTIDSSKLLSDNKDKLPQNQDAKQPK